MINGIHLLHFAFSRSPKKLWCPEYDDLVLLTFPALNQNVKNVSVSILWRYRKHKWLTSLRYESAVLPYRTSGRGSIRQTTHRMSPRTPTWEKRHGRNDGAPNKPEKARFKHYDHDRQDPGCHAKYGSILHWALHALVKKTNTRQTFPWNNNNGVPHLLYSNNF